MYLPIIKILCGVEVSFFFGVWYDGHSREKVRIQNLTFFTFCVNVGANLRRLTMEEINLKELFLYFKSKLLYLVAIIVTVCFVGVFYLTVVQQPRYESSTSLILTGFSNADKNNEATISTNDLTINQKLLATYQEITKSKKVLEQVIQSLNLSYSVETLAKHVSVTGVTDTEIIKITVIDGDAERAYQIVGKIAEIFSEEVKTIYNVSNVSILDTPSIASRASNMGLQKSIFVSFVLGVILACILLFITYYFDTTIKNANQIEAKVDVPVLGSIPDYRKKKVQKKKRGN